MARHPRSAVAVADTPDRALTERENRLVTVICAAAMEGKSLTRQEAGEAAGFGSGESARVSASRALPRPAVRQALLAHLRETAEVGAPDAFAVLRHVAASPGSQRDRLLAARELLSLAGLVGEPGPRVGTVTLELHMRPEYVRALNAPPHVSVVPLPGGRLSE